MPAPQDPVTQKLIAAMSNTQAWRFAGLVQDRLTRPVREKIIANPVNAAPGSPDCSVNTFIAPNGMQVRASNGVERECETWIDTSTDGGKTWTRVATFKKDDEIVSAKALNSVEHPYMYCKEMKGETWLVLGNSASEKETKCWDIREREAPLAHLDRLQGAPLRSVLSGNSEYAYKDGVPIKAPDDGGVYFAATRHHISGAPETGVNADTVLCKLDDATQRYAIMGMLLPRGARRDLDKTCNRISSEVVFPDGTRFWGCDVRNAEPHNAAVRHPLKTGDHASWVLGNFDEITSFAIGTWAKGTKSPKTASINAILGWSQHPRYPALRYLGIAVLISPAEITALASAPPEEDETPAVLLSYERAADTGDKCTFQQVISKQQLGKALSGKGPKVIMGEDPIAEVRQRYF